MLYLQVFKTIFYGKSGFYDFTRTPRCTSHGTSPTRSRVVFPELMTVFEEICWTEVGETEVEGPSLIYFEGNRGPTPSPVRHLGTLGKKFGPPLGRLW